MQQYYDIIIIGSGAGGGTLAYALAAISKRILLLELGDYILKEKRIWNNTSVLYAISTVKNETIFQKTLATNDFYFGSSKETKALGHVVSMGKHKCEMMRLGFPRWISSSLLKVFANHFVDWWMQSEDLPKVENRVEIAKNKQIKVYYCPNNLQAHRRLRHQLEKMLVKAGFPIILGGTYAIKSNESSGRNLPLKEVTQKLMFSI